MNMRTSQKRIDSTCTRSAKKDTPHWPNYQHRACLLENSRTWSQNSAAIRMFFCCGCFSDLTTVLRLLHQNSQATLPHASLELYKTRARRSRYTS